MNLYDRIKTNKHTFIVAEAGINHNGKISLAKEMILKAKECGADAIKFQTFKAEDFISNPADIYTYTSNGKQVKESMLDMFKRHEFSKDEWIEIIEYCKINNILFLTTPQNPSDLDFILSIVKLPLIKVGSDDLTNLDLLGYYAAKNIPMIISAGMAYLSEIDEALTAIRSNGCNDIIVLHCVSSYPAEATEVNLKKMESIASIFNVVVGFSDHTVGIAASIAAVALGAKIIEKHFTLDKNSEGPDHWFSINPNELRMLVEGVRYTEEALGNSQIVPTAKEMDMRKLARRSIVAAKDIPAGEAITDESICFKRPGTGLAPKFKNFVLNRTAREPIQKNELITLKKI